MTKDMKWLVIGTLAVFISGICLIGAHEPLNRIFWIILFGINCAALPERITAARRNHGERQ